MQKTRWLWVSLLWLAVSCAGTSAQKPALPAAQLLGQQRAALEEALPGGQRSGQWYSYQEGSLRVRYKQGRAVEIKAQVPEDLTCRQAAHWVGFPDATAPRLDRHRCAWPAQDPRHRLGQGFSGSLDRRKHLFHAYHHP